MKVPLFLLGLGIGVTVACLGYVLFGMPAVRRVQAALEVERTDHANTRAALVDLLNSLDEHDANIHVLNNVIERGLAVSGMRITETQEKVIDDREERVRKMYADGLSMNSIQEIIFGYSGGSAYRFVSAVLNGTSTEGIA